MMRAHTAVLVLNHFLDEHLVEHYRSIDAGTGPGYDVYLLSDRTQASVSLARLPRGAREFTFATEQLEALPYPARCSAISQRTGARNMKLGCADLPVLLFARDHPQYDYYWLIEYDVRFSGSWRVLFSAFEGNPADLLGTSLTRHRECPEWSHWSGLMVPNPEFDFRCGVRGFFPVYRLSQRAVRCYDDACSRGADGHMETLLPTVVAQSGLIVEDIGGDGAFVAPGNRGRFYRNVRHTNRLSPGTFVYRPARDTAGTEPNMLWHPVKPRSSAMSFRVRRLASRVLTAAWR